jgi:hypothetical protein
LRRTKSFDEILALLEDGLLLSDNENERRHFQSYVSQLRSTRPWSTPSVVLPAIVKAADAGGVEEQLKVAFCYVHADCGFPLNYELAVRYSKMASDAGNPEGEYMDGCFLAHGLGVSQPSASALDCFYKAINHPNVSPICTLH